jgi:VWFA-related protein
MHRRSVHILLMIAALVPTLGTGLGPLAAAMPISAAPPATQIATPGSAGPSSVGVDVVAVDRDGRMVESLGAEDFRVTVDGRPARILSVRRLLRGPGASEAAALQGRRDRMLAFAAEPVRNVLVVIDQTLVQRGGEAVIVQAAGVLLDRLGLDDRVAVARVPVAAGRTMAFTTDRPSAHEALRAVSGQQTASPAADEAAVPQIADKVTEIDRAREKGLDPEKAAESVLPARDAGAFSAVSFEDLERVQTSLGGLQSYLRALQPIPGRKTVIVFTGGLPPSARNMGVRSDDLARTAAAARAVIYAIGVPRAHADSRTAPDFSVIESLVARTGGAFRMLDTDPNRTVERIVPDLSACYALTVESDSAESSGKARALRVETTRKGVTLHVASWLVRRDDPEDPVVWAPTQAASAASETAPVRPADVTRASRPEPPGGPNRSRDPDLDLALSRLADYVDAYQRAFSAVVVEETYQQSTDSLSTKLRSDLLLVRLANGQTWTSFRDVFEADGVPVRDREERLRRLFLERPSSEAVAQAQAIKDESARYNIGPIERNVNVPFFPLSVLAAENRWRFEFKLAKKGESGGQQAWRIEYEERVHPTLIRNPRTRGDAPVKGWFVADPISGAVLETQMDVDDPDVKGRFAVKYRRDPSLGLWVPSEMKEDYTFTTRAVVGQRVIMSAGRMQARATYSNLRRFQVTTEEKIRIPK